MVTQLPLSLVYDGGRQHDLPPKWDGRRVEWSGWELPPPMTLDFHVDREVCHGCASGARKVLSWGTTMPEPGETVPVWKPRRTKSGRSYEAAGRSAATPFRQLMALRCVDCRLDVVWDMKTDEWWDLDAGDYSSEGSVES